MSLFKLREWWTTQCGHGEEFDVRSMCIANIDNHENREAKIITGSFQGMLRIYHPKDNEFRVEDLLLETQLEGPILQLEAGFFTQVSNQYALAVLHPRKLAVYTVAAGGGTGGAQASYFALTKAYEHVLKNPACNFVYGGFGAFAGQDHICVQSMDSILSFFEAENFAFSRTLHNGLVPGPLCYCAKMDAFITCNAAFEVECYKYQSLATSSDEARAHAPPAHEDEETSAGAAPAGAAGGRPNLVQKKRIQLEWSLVLGEPAVDIRVARFCASSLGTNQLDIVVLAERSLYCISETGALRFQKRLDYNPFAVIPYAATLDKDPMTKGSHHLIIADTTGALLFYKESTLIWAAKGDFVPVSVGVGKFKHLPGMVVTLGEQGHLSVTYLGTDPPLHVVGAYEGKELDYEEMDAEHQHLLGVIREFTGDKRLEPAERLVLRAQVPSRLDHISNMDHEDDHGLQGVRSPRNAKQVTARLFVSYTGKEVLENVSVSVAVPPPATCSEPLITIPQIAGGRSTPIIVPITIVAGASAVPSSMTVSVVAAYTTGNGEPRSATCSFQLPMVLACTIVQPIKKATYKITLDTNRLPPQLNTLFDEVVAESPLAHDRTIASGNVLSFQFWNGDDCTILVSKNAGRYRLQSSTFEALWLPVQELCTRLQMYFASVEKGQPVPAEGPFEVTFQETLPLQDFFTLVDAHFALRQELRAGSEQLAGLAQQLRSVQKRLLVRFKDRTPTPLNSLDVLLGNTYGDIMAAADNVEATKEGLLMASIRLSAGCRTLLLLMRYRFKLNDESYKVLEGYLSPLVAESEEQGWEETTEAGIAHLLKTTLSKNTKDAITLAGQQGNALATDTSKLKKHVSLVAERLGKGAQLTKGAPSGGGKASK
eukprot:jgi/Mesvir1/10184/Mv16992-RA.1